MGSRRWDIGRIDMKTNAEKMKRKIISILRRHDVVKAALFGSYARGEATPKSDVDILIEFGGKGSKSLLDLVGLEQELIKTLGRKVDVLTYNSIHPLLKEHILEEQEVFYEEG